MATILGIDPGASGGIAAIRQSTASNPGRTLELPFQARSLRMYSSGRVPKNARGCFGTVTGSQFGCFQGRSRCGGRFRYQTEIFQCAVPSQGDAQEQSSFSPSGGLGSKQVCAHHVVPFCTSVRLPIVRCSAQSGILRCTPCHCRLWTVPHREAFDSYSFLGTQADRTRNKTISGSRTFSTSP